MKRVIAIIILFATALTSLLFSLDKGNELNNSFSFDFVSYSELYKQAQNSLAKSDCDSIQKLTLDSLFYFNPEKDRFVSCLHASYSGRRFADELSFVYGEKISGHWFFFKGGTYLLPRALFNNNDSLPLSYMQFHSAALEDIFYPFAFSGNFDFKNAQFFQSTCIANNGSVKKKF